MYAPPSSSASTPTAQSSPPLVPSLQPHSRLPFGDTFTMKAFSPPSRPSLASAATPIVQFQLIHVPRDAFAQDTLEEVAIKEVAAAAKVVEADEVDLGTAVDELVTGEEDVAALLLDVD